MKVSRLSSRSAATLWAAHAPGAARAREGDGRRTSSTWSKRRGINVVVSTATAQGRHDQQHAFAYAIRQRRQDPGMPVPRGPWRHEPGATSAINCPRVCLNDLEASRHQPFYGVRRIERSWIPRSRRSRTPRSRDEAFLTEKRPNQAERRAGRSRRTRVLTGISRRLAETVRIIEFDAVRASWTAVTWSSTGGGGSVPVFEEEREGLYEGRSRGHRQGQFRFRQTDRRLRAPTCWSSDGCREGCVNWQARPGRDRHDDHCRRPEFIAQSEDSPRLHAPEGGRASVRAFPEQRRSSSLGAPLPVSSKTGTVISVNFLRVSGRLPNFRTMGD